MAVTSPRLLALCALVLGACEDDTRILDCEALCPRLVECGARTSTASCETLCRVYIHFPPCLDALAAATCLEMDDAEAVCFPECASARTRCEGNVLVGCDNGEERWARCEYLCLAYDEDYTGVCGREYRGEVTAQPVCWCAEPLPDNPWLFAAARELPR
jgi:hypothetical protein